MNLSRLCAAVAVVALLAAAFGWVPLLPAVVVAIALVALALLA